MRLFAGCLLSIAAILLIAALAVSPISTDAAWWIALAAVPWLGVLFGTWAGFVMPGQLLGRANVRLYERASYVARELGRMLIMAVVLTAFALAAAVFFLCAGPR